MQSKAFGLAASIAVIALTFGGSVHAAPVTIDSRADIFSPAGDTAGNPAVQLSATGGSTYTFAPVTGTITFNTFFNINDADGFNAEVGASTIFGVGSMSGISAPNAGYLVGVFVAAGGPSGPAPAMLTYSNTSALSYSPLLNQVFFIGDGLTGHNTGSVQQFIAPTNAAFLYLGLADACGYYGTPSCYGDNYGTFSSTINVVAVASPVPAALPLFASGLAGLGWLARRKRKPAA